MLERLFCAALGHRYVVERVLNHGARKVGCTRCGKVWKELSNIIDLAELEVIDGHKRTTRYKIINQ